MEEGGFCMDMTPYTWGKLATVAGAAAATMMIVQFIKGPVDQIVKMPTRWLVYVVALVVLLAAQIFSVGFAWSDIPLILLNALLATFAAMGGYEATFAGADAARATAVPKK